MIHHQWKQSLILFQLFSLSNSQSSNQYNNKYSSPLRKCRLQCKCHQDKQSQPQKIIQLQCKQHQIIDRQILKLKSQKENSMRVIAKQVAAKKISDLLKEIGQWVQKNQLHSQNRLYNIHCSQLKNNQNQLLNRILRNQLSLMIQTMMTMMMISNSKDQALRHQQPRSQNQLLQHQLKQLQLSQKPSQKQPPKIHLVKRRACLILTQMMSTEQQPNQSQIMLRFTQT